MVCCLLVGIGQFDDSPFIVRPSHKGNARWKIIGGESGGNRDNGDEHQEGIEMRCALGIYPRRVDAVFDQRRRVLYRFMNDRIQLIVRHDFQHIEHEFLARSEVPVMFGLVPRGPSEVGRISYDAGEIRRVHHLLLSLEWWMSATSEKRLKCVRPFGWAFRACIQQLVQVWNHDGID